MWLWCGHITGNPWVHGSFRFSVWGLGSNLHAVKSLWVSVIYFVMFNSLKVPSGYNSYYYYSPKLYLVTIRAHTESVMTSNLSLASHSEGVSYFHSFAPFRKLAFELRSLKLRLLAQWGITQEEIMGLVRKFKKLLTASEGPWKTCQRMDKIWTSRGCRGGRRGREDTDIPSPQITYNCAESLADRVAAGWLCQIVA